MKPIHLGIFYLFALVCFWVTNTQAAEKLIADYGGHAGVQNATWGGKGMKIFDKYGLDVGGIMITGAARAVAARLGNSTHFFTRSAAGPLAAPATGAAV